MEVPVLLRCRAARRRPVHILLRGALIIRSAMPLPLAESRPTDHTGGKTPVTGKVSISARCKNRCGLILVLPPRKWYHSGFGHKIWPQFGLSLVPGASGQSEFGLGRDGKNPSPAKTATNKYMSVCSRKPRPGGETTPSSNEGGKPKPSTTDQRYKIPQSPALTQR